MSNSKFIKGQKNITTQKVDKSYEDGKIYMIRYVKNGEKNEADENNQSNIDDIIDINNNIDKVYIGSTCDTLSNRLIHHVKEYNGYLKKKRRYCSSFKILELGNYDIVLLENYPCSCRDELLLREAEYITVGMEEGTCVNTQIPKNINNPIIIRDLYQRGKIYKIISKHTNKIYIGSTIQKLNERLSGHVKDCKKYKTGYMHYTSSFDIIGLGDYEIVLLETYPCNTNKELLIKEQEYIDRFRDICVNKQNAVKDPNYQSKYNLRNKELRRIKSKIYRDAHKTEISEKGKLYWIKKGTECMAKKKDNKIKKMNDILNNKLGDLELDL
jgi:predicted GIY-YIG superfamily endonuclease